jgi:large conductance mechanosensitive channel
MAKKKQAVGFEGFKEFIRKQGVVGFGVAFVLGTAVAEFINKFIAAVVQPIISAISGNSDISEALVVEVGEASLMFGSAIQALIDFLVIALVVYMLVKTTGVDQWDEE